jgi:hypothetical protein
MNPVQPRSIVAAVTLFLTVHTDWVLAKIDLDMSVEEAKVLHICCDTLAALFKTTEAR